MSYFMADQKNICPDCGTRMQFASGCRFCPNPGCGYAVCGRAVETFAAGVLVLALLVMMVLA